MKDKTDSSHLSHNDRASFCPFQLDTTPTRGEEGDEPKGYGGTRGGYEKGKW